MNRLAHLITALPSEAKPLIDHYRLKKLTDEHAFAVYRRDALTLTVSGIGKVASSAAVAYTHLLFEKPAHAIWLNIGVAGHPEKEIGTPFLCNKISDADSGKTHYPVFVTPMPCDDLPITSHSNPQFDHPDGTLCDMEASGFFETASRFSSAELIHGFKVVSDNRETGVETVSAKRATRLIEQQLPLIDELIDRLQSLRHSLPSCKPSIPSDWLQRWRFTASERKQLNVLIQRWTLLAPNAPLESEQPPETGDRKKVLDWLRDKVDSLPIDLS